ncbi:MAG: hypothetical protein C6W56_16260 [Caldibacillus debilis]|nr:MAG: hypothetical protein C6W56_16260 [Caldibacillus debilis]
MTDISAGYDHCSGFPHKTRFPLPCLFLGTGGVFHICPCSVSGRKGYGVTSQIKGIFAALKEEKMGNIKNFLLSFTILLTIILAGCQNGVHPEGIGGKGETNSEENKEGSEYAGESGKETGGPTIETGVISIAHRGAPFFAPEHTIPSYEIAAGLGADYIELDLQMTKDGVLVSIHDKTVGRTTGGQGEVASYTLKELKRLDADHSFAGRERKRYAHVKIPTLEEVLERFGDSVNYYIEIKNPADNPGMEKALIDTLKKFQLLHKKDKNGLPKVIIQSFSPKSLKSVQRMEPGLPLIRLFNEKDFASLTDDAIKELQTYASGVGLPFRSVTKKEIDRLHSYGLDVHVYTINDKKTMEQYIDYGVDGIFTDHIDQLLEILHMRQNSPNEKSRIHRLPQKSDEFGIRPSD